MSDYICIKCEYAIKNSGEMNFCPKCGTPIQKNVNVFSENEIEKNENYTDEYDEFILDLQMNFQSLRDWKESYRVSEGKMQYDFFLIKFIRSLSNDAPFKLELQKKLTNMLRFAQEAIKLHPELKELVSKVPEKHCDNPKHIDSNLNMNCVFSDSREGLFRKEQNYSIMEAFDVQIENVKNWYNAGKYISIDCDGEFIDFLELFRDICFRIYNEIKENNYNYKDIFELYDKFPIGYSEEFCDKLNDIMGREIVELKQPYISFVDDEKETIGRYWFYNPRAERWTDVIKVRVHNVPSPYTVCYSILENAYISSEWVEDDSAFGNWRDKYEGNYINEVNYGNWTDTNELELIIEKNPRYGDWVGNFVMRVYIQQYPDIEGMVTTHF